MTHQPDVVARHNSSGFAGDESSVYKKARPHREGEGRAGVVRLLGCLDRDNPCHDRVRRTAYNFDSCISERSGSGVSNNIAPLGSAVEVAKPQEIIEQDRYRVLEPIEKRQRILPDGDEEVRRRRIGHDGVDGLG